MSNSPLVNYTRISKNKNSPRTMKIDRITPHCVVGQCTAEGLGDWFSNPLCKGSSNYGVDKDGRIGMYVEEKDRSWCSSSPANDHRAVTIEIASDKTAPYAMTDKAYFMFINLATDICKRNGKTKLLWFKDKATALSYKPKDNEMLLTVHQWFANTDCPGDWLLSRLGEVAAEVTKRLTPAPTKKTIYRVQVGAYSVKANAENKLKKVKAAGFTDAFIAKAEV